MGVGITGGINPLVEPSGGTGPPPPTNDTCWWTPPATIPVWPCCWLTPLAPASPFSFTTTGEDSCDWPSGSLAKVGCCMVITFTGAAPVGTTDIPWGYCSCGGGVLLAPGPIWTPTGLTTVNGCGCWADGWGGQGPVAMAIIWGWWGCGWWFKGATIRWPMGCCWAIIGWCCPPPVGYVM